MKSKTFAVPLKKPSSGRFYNVSNDYKSIGEEYHRRFGGDPFAPVVSQPFVQPKPDQACTYKDCPAKFSYVTKTWSKGCSGKCQEC